MVIRRLMVAGACAMLLTACAHSQQAGGYGKENLVVQGYGEAELRIDTQGEERANRRAAVRIISPLMWSASN